MSKGFWLDFYHTLTIDADCGRPVAKPTEQQLNEFEQESGFLLPKSYRDFIQIFGPGDFLLSLEIAAPGYDNLVKEEMDLKRANKVYRLTSDEMSTLSQHDATRANRLYYFGFIYGRDPLGWDITDVMNAENNEYAIYQGFYQHKVIAVSFQELVLTVCDELFKPDPSWNEEELGPQRAFTPAVYE